MPAARLNIIHFVCHDLGRTLGCYGKPVSSPNLDRFASQGALFANAFCTSPACSPSRGCAMTGQYAHTNGLMGLVNMGWSLPDEARTIVDYLNDADCLTAHVGLQHERYEARANRYQIEGNTSATDIFAENATTAAIDFLGEHAAHAQPFYLNVGTIEVHGSQWQGKRDGGARLSAYGSLPAADAYVPRAFPDAPQVRREMVKYQAAIRFLDMQFGRLMDAVDRLGLTDRTLVIFTTDHGMAGMRAKMTLYDLGVETALMARLPGVIAPGTVVDHLAPNIDVLPTLLDAAGVPVPSQVQGRSLWPCLTGGPYAPHEAIFTERNYHAGAGSNYDPMRSVRTPELHYIRNFDPDARMYWLPDEVPYLAEDYDDWWDEMWPALSIPRDETELFDLRSDPDEFRNVAADPAYADARRDLEASLRRWMFETGDPLLEGAIPDRLNPWPERRQAAT